jgi:anaerobic selenocysteine-containing dehydrogenase
MPPAANDTHIAYHACPLCEATCGLELTIQGGRVLKVRGDRQDVFSHGYLCPKGAALAELQDDPDRLRAPLVRRSGVFQAVSWAEAFAEVERGLMPIIKEQGRDAVGVYLGNPCSHTLAANLCLKPLLKALGTRNIFTASTVDQIPMHVACGLMYGNPLAIPVPDLDRADFLLILGADPLESNGSLATAPDFPGRLRALKARGGRLVVIDPRRSRTAKLAHEHIFIRPGGDAFLLMAMVHTLFQEKLVALGRLEALSAGLEELGQLCASFPPEAVEGACGIPAAEIRRLARELAASPRAAVYGRMGTCTVAFGTLATWLIQVLNILTGNLDRPGGTMFPSPAHLPEPRRAGGKGWGMGRWRSRVGGWPEALGEFPVHAMCEEMETPGPGQVRALVTVAGNPVMALPNAGRVDRALGGLEFMVAVDFYLNPSTRHASVILPPTGPLTSSHYDVTFYNFAVRNVARYSPPALPKPAGEMDQGEIFYRLALIAGGQGAGADPARLEERLTATMVEQATGPGSPLAGRGPEVFTALKAWRGPERILDFMLRTGSRGDGFGLNTGGLCLARLSEHPHGLDLGPLEPRLPAILRTPSARIELVPAPLAAEVPRLAAALAAPPTPAGDGLLLVGRRHLRTNNSWLANLPSLVKGKPRCTLHIHPRDAAALGLAGGQAVRVVSRVGAVVLPAEITEDIMPGVVCAPHGWGHDGAGVALAVARRQPGINVNLLHDDQAFDQCSHNSVLNGLPVRLEPAGRE